MPDETPESAPGGRGLDRSQVGDSVQQAFNPAPMTWGKGDDGLPSPVLKGHLPIVAPLSPDTFVCLADTREFVMRNRWGEVAASFQPSIVRRTPSGAYYVSIEQALESHAGVFEIARHLHLGSLRVEVEPVRPQCRFLAQQMTDFQDASEHRMVERLCTARRDEESFFVGLRDTQLHACELRSPRDQASLERIEIFNRTKIELGKERLRETGESFDVDKALGRALHEAEEDGLTTSGIFAERK